MATKSKVTALSARGNQVVIERDGRVRESKLYLSTPSSLARVCKIINNLPWQNTTLAFVGDDYFIAENADIHKR